MLIGYPWDIREVRTPGRGARRAPMLNAVEHTTLSGAVRTTARRMTRRRWNVSLPWLTEVEADWIRFLAERLDGPGPIVMIEPATRNFLGARQSLGRGAAADYSPTAGTLAPQPDRSLLWTHTAGASLRWVNRVWARWPAAPDMQVTFTHAAAGLSSGITWFSRAGVNLGSTASSTATITATAPAGVCWMTPYALATGAGSTTVPRACLNYGPTADLAVPGEHVGAFGITNADDLLEVLPSKSATLELVEY
ncbi:hypothetical protein [Amycolatopsis magusensis]|uniref:hypothetical protein n=1 Tax=Amycolatopsis magusensis TaxID=882444 RepID=UPI0037AF0745